MATDQRLQKQRVDRRAGRRPRQLSAAQIAKGTSLLNTCSVDGPVVARSSKVARYEESRTAASPRSRDPRSRDSDLLDRSAEGNEPGAWALPQAPIAPGQVRSDASRRRESLRRHLAREVWASTAISTAQSSWRARSPLAPSL